MACEKQAPFAKHQSSKYLDELDELVKRTVREILAMLAGSL